MCSSNPTQRGTTLKSNDCCDSLDEPRPELVRERAPPGVEFNRHFRQDPNAYPYHVLILRQVWTPRVLKLPLNLSSTLNPRCLLNCIPGVEGVLEGVSGHVGQVRRVDVGEPEQPPREEARVSGMIGGIQFT